LESDGVDVQEVAGDDGVGLDGEEFASGRAGAAWSGVDAGGVQDVPDSRCGEGVAEPDQFALDSAVAPPAVLGG
jgi:hypothetical protein